MSSKPHSLEERLDAHPQLKARSDALLAIVEEVEGELQRADDAERRVIEELRRSGPEALQGWARGQEAEQAAAVRVQAGVCGQGKKNSTGTRRLAREGWLSTCSGTRAGY
jgi:hypothetical protein